MNSGPKDLWLLTMRFPHDVTESFLENELPVLCKHFRKVYLIPQVFDAAQRPIPHNAEVIHLDGACYQAGSIGEMLRYLPQLWSLWRSLKNDAPSSNALEQERRVLINRLRHAARRTAVLDQLLQERLDPNTGVIYSYWTAEWATSLAIIHARNSNIRFITRAHGFDLYEHQNPRGWIPFRKYQLRQLDRLYAVSTAGLEHLRSTHPEFSTKYKLACLGTTDHGIGPWEEPAPLRVVSCSQIIPRKRLLLWLQVLQKVTVPIEWVHFGDGVERAQVEAQVSKLPAHIDATLKGNRANGEIMAWYKAHTVHLFTLFSELEGGVAVSAQEAASFGIPLLVTDSGGVRDLLNERTGVLLPTNPNVVEVARWIDDFATSERCTDEFRTGVRAFWKENFSAQQAYGRFCTEELGAPEPEIP